MDSTTPTLSGLKPLTSIEDLSEYLNVPSGRCTTGAWSAKDRARFTSEIGTVGDITDVKVSGARVRARTRCRDDAGQVGRVSATGATNEEAEGGLALAAALSVNIVVWR